MSKTIRFFVVALVVAMVFAAGWLVEGWRKDAEISQINEAAAKEQGRAAGVAIVRLAAAQKRGDQLALTLAGWETTIHAFAEEKNREISRLVTGRRCLDSAVVGVLNRPDVQLNGAVSKTPGLVLRGDGSATTSADDGAFATDGDVAGWIGLCQRSYNTCRAHLKAIGDFYAGESASD